MINYFISLDSNYLPMIIYSSSVLMCTFAFEIASLGMKYNVRDEAILLGYNACICIFTWLIDVTNSLFSRRLCLLGCSLLLVFFYELGSRMVMYREIHCSSVDYDVVDNEQEDNSDVDQDDSSEVEQEDNSDVEQDDSSEVDNQQEDSCSEVEQDASNDVDNQQDDSSDVDKDGTKNNNVPELEMATDLDTNQQTNNE
jgi:hypothetical protein